MQRPSPTHLFFLFSFWLFQAFSAEGQSVESLRVDAHYTGQSLEEILADLHTRLGVPIFYPAQSLPPGGFTRHYQQAPLGEVLTDLLRESTLGYSIYRDYAVVIGARAVLNEDFNSALYRALLKKLLTPAEPADLPPLVIGDSRQRRTGSQVQVSGTITDATTNESLTGVSLFFPDLETGTTSDESGSYSIVLPVGKWTMQVQSLGYQEVLRQVDIYSEGRLDLRLEKGAIALQEVIVRDRAPDANVASAQIGLTRLDVRSIRALPAFLGEADVVRSLLTQPGVSTIGEGAAGFNVRGGAVDQNLVMQDDAFLFNSSHALGFFSTFNTDLISSVQLFKGAMPASYGGRLASVLDVEMRNGDFQKWKGGAGISPVSGHLTVEGPLVRDKVSVIAGIRGAYSDWVLQLVPDPRVRASAASFFDGNLRITNRLNDRQTLVLSGYMAHDNFRYADEFGFAYQTRIGQLEHRAELGKSLRSGFSAILSDFQSQQDEGAGLDAARLSTSIRYLKVKERLTYTPSESLLLEGGLSGIGYKVHPGKFSANGPSSIIVPREAEAEQALETAAYLQMEWSASAKLSLSAGLRGVYYLYFGPQTVFRYLGSPAGEASVIDTVRYRRGESIADYSSIEPRLSLRYRLTPAASLKAGYSRTAQFINQIYNADTPTPTSIWQLSTDIIRPFRSHNFSLGFFQNLAKNQFETSLEAYYRSVDALFDYRDFADLTANGYLERELLPGRGRAYGLELSLRRRQGRLNGWINYTLSRTERRVDGINAGTWYPANFDKLHDLNVTTNLEINRRHQLSLTFNYSTGRPTTAPVGNYYLPNGMLAPVYSQRNAIRIPDYHRLDIAYSIGPGLKKTNAFRTSWTFAVYNLYGRRNPFSVYFTQGSVLSAKRLAILGGIFPSLTLNIELD